MNDKLISEQLRDSEELLGVVRRSPFAHSRGFGVSLVLIIASFFFLYPILQLGRWGLYLLLVLLLVGIYLFLRTLIIYRMNLLILTSERVLDIDQHGLFSRVVSECLYDNIQEMSVHISGVLGTMFRIGELRIHTKGDRADLSIAGIQHPQKVQEAIASIQKKMSEHDDEGKLTAEEMVTLLEKIKKNINIPKLTDLGSNRTHHDKN